MGGVGGDKLRWELVHQAHTSADLRYSKVSAAYSRDIPSPTPFTSTSVDTPPAPGEGDRHKGESMPVGGRCEVGCIRGGQGGGCSSPHRGPSLGCISAAGWPVGGASLDQMVLVRGKGPT